MILLTSDGTSSSSTSTQAQGEETPTVLLQDKLTSSPSPMGVCETNRDLPWGPTRCVSRRPRRRGVGDVRCPGTDFVVEQWGRATVEGTQGSTSRPKVRRGTPVTKGVGTLSGFSSESSNPFGPRAFPVPRPRWTTGRVTGENSSISTPSGTDRRGDRGVTPDPDCETRVDVSRMTPVTSLSYTPERSVPMST